MHTWNALRIPAAAGQPIGVVRTERYTVVIVALVTLTAINRYAGGRRTWARPRPRAPYAARVLLKFEHFFLFNVSKRLWEKTAVRWRKRQLPNVQVTRDIHSEIPTSRCWNVLYVSKKPVHTPLFRLSRQVQQDKSLTKLVLATLATIDSSLSCTRLYCTA